jgi:2'-5' RNA ligase
VQASNNIMLLAMPKLQGGAWQYIQDLRAQYYPAGHDFLPPHFTLFTLPATLAETALNAISNQPLQAKIVFCLRSALFMPPLHGHQSWYTFLMPEQGFSELAKLQRRLSLDLQPEQDSPFIPHITVGKFSTPKACWQLVDAINASQLELSGWIETLILVDNAVVMAEVKLR